jgi:hypothetical protein
MKVCIVGGCGRTAETKAKGCRGLCQWHYRQFLRHGVPLANPKQRDKMGPRNPKWRGGQIKGPQGRILVYQPNHPYPNSYGRYVLRYRLVLEAFLGRYLRPDEIVHHRDGDVTNDHLGNLTIFSRRRHQLLHIADRKRDSKGRWISHTNS